MSNVPLDQDCQIRDWDELVGHTIKAVIESPLGKRNVSAVIITETGCWMAIDADGGSLHDEKPYALIDPPYHGGGDIPLDQYLSANDLLRAGLINQATYQLLKEKEDQEAAAAKKAKAERLRKQLQELEGGAA